LKLVEALINSNVYIALAAVSLTIATQLQLGMEPQWHPYLFIILFATLFEYNIHRLVTVITNKEVLKTDKYKWVNDNLPMFYWLMGFSTVGFMVAVFLAKREVLLTLAPIAALTLFYSVPIFSNRQSIFRLREIPFLKIFLIAFVWSVSTILLPIIQSGHAFNWGHVMAMLAERFFFVFAITIPFDIRDMESDKRAGLKTIPLLLSANKSWTIAYIALLLFWLVSFAHYQPLNYWFAIVALSISALTTFVFLKSEKIRRLPLYHYGILDGTMLLQGLLVLLFYYIQTMFRV
jgi:4-hydroxybenzoate polyprenyltransferase